MNTNNESGHALFLVMLISLMLFLVITHVTVSYTQQVQSLHLKEMDIRMQTMLRNSVVLWFSDQQALMNSQAEQQSEHERILQTEFQSEHIVVNRSQTYHYAEGSVRVDVNVDNSTETYWDLRMTAYVPTRDAYDFRQSVHVQLLKKGGSLIYWRDD